MSRRPTQLEWIISEAGAAAYLACLQAGKVKRRTERLGLVRETYDVEYAAAASEAVKKYLASAMSAFGQDPEEGLEAPKGHRNDPQ